MALPLTRCPNAKGQYFGFDIVKDRIRWCQDNISSKYPNFHFIHADVYNPCYNVTGKFAPDDYIFSYPDNKFDFIA